jgi:hypothetical protein
MIPSSFNIRKQSICCSRLIADPVADQECLIMLIERKSTLHTGAIVTEKTRSLSEQLRPLTD